MVEYGREFQARAADELVRLQDGSAISEMLSENAVMRDQAGRGDDDRTRNLHAWPAFIGPVTYAGISHESDPN